MQVKTPKNAVIDLPNDLKALVNFTWGNGKNPELLKATITVKRNGEESVIGDIDGPFESVEEAVEISNQIANSWYDRGNS